MHIVATRDIVSDVHGQPVFVPHVGQAIRSFGDECRRKEPGNVLAGHPEDFELVYLGVYDDITGEIDQGLRPDGSLNDTGKRIQLAVGGNYRDN